MRSGFIERLAAPHHLPLRNNKPRQMAGFVCGLR